MKFQDYIEQVRKLSFGKRLPDAIYILRPEPLRADDPLHATIARAATAASVADTWNLLKLHLKEYSISFLCYPDFDENPHPALQQATKINLNSGRVVRTDFSKRANPPILHRKESFLPPNDPRQELFAALTRQEEAAGLFRDLSRIGHRLYWDSLIRNKGLYYNGHKLQQAESATMPPIKDDIKVERHRTAIKRYDLSKPVKLLMKHGLLRPGRSFFDYGCGHGMDVEGLQSLDYKANGWDPAFAPNNPKHPADVVNLGYVLNVIERPDERADAIKAAFKLTKDVLIVSVLAKGQESSAHTLAVGDGFLTKTGTFQKFYAPGELEDLIFECTHSEPVTLALGIALVFRDAEHREAFLSQRPRRHFDWSNLQTQLRFSVPSEREQQLVGKYELHRELLDAFWNTALELGRLPEAWEFPRWADLSKTGGAQRSLDILLQYHGNEPLQEARRLHEEDLLVYLAMKHFEPRFLQKHLTQRSRLDVKAFFGRFESAKQKSLQLLYASGDPEELRLAIEPLDFGHWDPVEEHFTFHRGLLDAMPAILRVYVFCGLQRFGDLDETDLIKIHLRSGKLTLHTYDDFDKTLPELQVRIKIDLRRNFVSVFDHTLGPDRQLLFFKERFVGADYPGFKKALAFSKRVRKLGFKAESIGYGPTKTQFREFAEAAGLTLNLLPKRSA